MDFIKERITKPIISEIRHHFRARYGEHQVRNDECGVFDIQGWAARLSWSGIELSVDELCAALFISMQNELHLAKYAIQHA